MYNNSYKGYKRKKYKYNSRNSIGNKKKKIKNPKAAMARLQVIRYTAIILAVVIALSVITVGLILYNKGQAQPIEGTADAVIFNNRDELLQIVNKNNPIEKDYVPELTEYESYSVNTLAAEALNNLLKSAQNEGIDLSVNYAYVSYDEQNEKYLAEYNKLLDKNNLTAVRAEAKAQAVVPKAGESEFQTGLLVSFKTDENTAFENSQAAKWLEKNCIAYGFVLRYTDAKKSKTLMNGDPCAYRYVGVEDASMMRTLDMCLNEYSSYISVRE